MIKITKIKSEWDCRRRPDPKWIYDQDTLEIEVDFDLFAVHAGPDSKITHQDPEGEAAFYVKSYMGGDFVDFTHHYGDPSINEGGFGGTVVNYRLADGTVESVAGPWSSGAYHYNQVVPESDHVYHTIIRRKGALSGYGADIRVSALLDLIRRESQPYVLVTGLFVDNNPFAYEIVHRDDVDEFVAHGGIRPGNEANLIGKGSSRWLGQTPEEFQAGIRSARVFRP